MGCIFIILDGLGDRSYEVLGGKTPLEAAHTPNMDRLASMGANGLMHALSPGHALTSENAHFALFGYDQEDFPGRGYLEAVGAGIDLNPEEVAILARLVYATEDTGRLILAKNWPETSDEEACQLFAAVSPFRSGETRFDFIRTSGTQGILVMRGNVSRFITDSNPINEGRHIIEPQAWASKRDDAYAQPSSRALGNYLRWCYKRLANHPVNTARQQNGQLPLNAVVTNRAGKYTHVDSFRDKWGLKALSIASGLIYHGLCRFVGMEVLEVKDSKNPGDDLADRLELAVSKLDEFDFIHVHTKAPDVASHTKNSVAKKNVIEELDKGIGRVFETLTANREHLVIITADHSTPCTEPMIHCGEPVPITAWGRGMRRDNVSRFNEIDCAEGALGFMYGRDFMYFVLNSLDRIKLSGLMDTPVGQPYWPGHRKPFTIRETD